MEIYKKLSEVKYKFHHIEINKSGKNTFANYSYMQLADFTKPLIQLLHAEGLVSFVSFTDTTATLTIVDVETGDKVENTSPMSKASLKGCHEVQNLGAVQTYIRRYLYMSMFDIVEGDALDGSQPLIPTGIETNDLIVLAAKKGFTSAKVEKYLKSKYGHGMQYISQVEHDETIAHFEGLDDK